MRLRNFLSLIYVSYLPSALGARVAIPADGSLALAGRGLKVAPGSFNKIAGPKLDTLKSTVKEATSAVKDHSTQGLGEARKLADSTKSKIGDGLVHVYEHAQAYDEEHIFSSFNNLPIMETCAERDCKRRHFLGEMVRWVKQAITDVGVFIKENPIVFAALLIGVSVLIASLITSGAVVPAALDAVGFGVQGPIKNSLAAAFQSKIGAIRAGSIFARLQAAAMRGVKMQEIHRMAAIGFLAAGLKLADSGMQTLGQSPDVEHKEWKVWQGTSRKNFSLGEADDMANLWGSFARQGCVAYGNRQYQAPIWYVPEGEGPLNACVSTPAIIHGIGFKGPLGCLDKGPKKGVVGTWYVPTNGSDCMPWWSKFEDEGCILYGQRRKFARLFGLSLGDNWTGVCESTPAIVDGKSFDRPSYCEDKGVLGIFGVFDFADETCECSCVRS